VRDQGEQRAPEGADIGEQHRLSVAAQLHPGELLDEFLERPDPAGQRDEASARSNIRALR